MCLFNNRSLLVTLIVLITFTDKVVVVYGAFGGHDLFTSLAQLEVLWHNDRQVVKDMENVIEKLDKVKKSLEGYVKSHYELRLEEEPNYEFLGHPINAYHLVRHVAAGWTNVRSALFENDTIPLKDDFDKLKSRESQKLPDTNDVDGAAHGLVRLYSLYQYNVSLFVDEGRISTVLDNGQVVHSVPSYLRVNSFDLSRLSAEAGANGLYDASTTFLDAAAKKAEEEVRAGINMSYFFDFHASPSQLQAMAATAKRVHDEVLVKRGMRSSHHRTFQYPFDKKLKKKKKFSKPETLEVILSRQEWNDMENKIKHDEDVSAKFLLIQETQRDKLCRGEQLRPVEELSKLHCKYVHHGSPWLRLGPIKMEINSFDPFHVVFKDLLTHEECDTITKFLGPKLDFPPGRMNSKSRRNDWTMKNCWPNEDDNIVLDKLNRRIEHVTGLRAATNKNFSEPFMCGNYGVGGHYWTHPDYHFPDPSHWLDPTSRGNRVATILTILDAPSAGGATVWPYAGISVFPEKGSAVFWHNVMPSDYPDTFTRHAACPVLFGQKWIGNKWVGYNAQWDKLNCDLLPFSGFKPIKN